MRSLLSHRVECPANGSIVVTTVSVFEANLIMLSISVSRSPSVSSVTMDRMSPEKSSRAGSEY